MAEVARGQISDRPFVRTIYTVAAKRFSGDLRIEGAAGAGAIAWHRGFVVAADVPGATGTLGERAAALFAVTDGEFVLDDASQLATVADEQPVDPRWVIFHGVAHHYDDDRLDRELAPLAQRTVSIARDALPALEAYGFDDGDHAWIKRLLERAWTLPELTDAVDGAGPHRIKSLIYALLATDALEIGEQAAPAAAPRTARATSSRTRATRATPAPNGNGRPKRVTIDPTDATVSGANELRRIITDRVQLVTARADHFQILGVARDADDATVRTAYFALAKQLHPDRVRQLKLDDLGDHASRIFARVNEAFAAIGEAAKRAEYIASLDSGEADADDPEAEAKMLAVFEAEEKFKLGEMALRRAHYGQALDDFRAALELNPEEGEHHAMFAWAMWKDARDKDTVVAEVKQRFRSGIRLSPNNPTIYYYRGKLALDLDDDEGAVFCFEKTLKLDPKHEAAFKQKRVAQNAVAVKQQPASDKRGKRDKRSKREKRAKS